MKQESICSKNKSMEIGRKFNKKDKMRTTKNKNKKAKRTRYVEGGDLIVKRDSKCSSFGTILYIN